MAAQRYESVHSVGIGIPGQVDAATGLVRNVVNLDIEQVELAEAVAGLVERPVRVDNDVNTAALGALRVIEKADTGVSVFLNFGTGLASGIVADGVLYHGCSGAAGEIGHIPVDPNRFPCPCGQYGCLETVCSGASIGRLWPQADPPMPDLISRADAGEPHAVEVLRIVLHAIGDALQIVAHSFDPKLIVLGGGMAKTGRPLLRAIVGELHDREAASPFLQGLDLAARLQLAPSDIPLGALGAALL